MQGTSKKKINFTAIPYGKFLDYLNENDEDKIFSPFLHHFLNSNNYTSLLKLMADYSDGLAKKTKTDIERNNYKRLVEVLKKQDWQIIGEPSKVIINERERVFLGCQLSIKKKRILYITPGLSLQQAVFVIAHELMHSLFTEDNFQRPGNLPSDKFEEFLCDYGAVRFLIPDSFIDKYIPEINRLTAEKIIILSKKLNVSRQLFSMKLFDILPFKRFNNIAAIIEWHLVKQEDSNSEFEIVPNWAVSRDSFIPHIKSKKRIATAKSNSCIYKSVMADGFINAFAFEETSIGTLHGTYNIVVCAAGSIENNTRFAVSIFYN